MLLNQDRIDTAIVPLRTVLMSPVATLMGQRGPGRQQTVFLDQPLIAKDGSLRRLAKGGAGIGETYPSATADCRVAMGSKYPRL